MEKERKEVQKTLFTILTSLLGTLRLSPGVTGGDLGPAALPTSVSRPTLPPIAHTYNCDSENGGSILFLINTSRRRNHLEIRMSTAMPHVSATFCTCWLVLFGAIAVADASVSVMVGGKAEEMSTLKFDPTTPT